MKSAIIFGITGQDGSHLADLLLEKDYQVIGVSRRCSVDNTQRIKHLSKNNRFNLVSGDITDPYSVSQILASNFNVDEIYNLAAQSHVAVSFTQPGLTWDITGKGCLNILQGIVDNRMGNVHFYQASSSEMFGKSYDTREVNVSPLECITEKYQDENTKFYPLSPYATSKLFGYWITKNYRESYGIYACNGILFNHESPRRGETFVTKKIVSGLYKIINNKQKEYHSKWLLKKQI